jgi:hypothetical protein
MPKRARLTKSGLLSQYESVDTRSRIIELLDLRSFLLHCVIKGKYKISDALNNALALSPYGDETLRELGKKQVPIKEGRLICFLEFYHLDLLVDPEAINPESLASAIGEEIRERRIALPLVHGPELYERAAELFADERSYLGPHDTQRLLEGASTGVFQMGHWVSGPQGLLRSPEDRALRPTLRLPLQHCHDVSCREVHPVQLSTDLSAAINEHRSAAAKVLEAQSEDPSEFPAFFADIARELDKSYDDFNAGALALLVADSLSDLELQYLLSHLMDHTGGALRERLSPIGAEGPSEKWVADKGRAELLQEILLATDQVLMRALDSLTFSGQIKVPEGEVRKPVLFQGARAGAFGIRPELSMLGLRLAGARDLAPLRMRRLVDNMYAATSDADMDSKRIQDAEELGWQLRSVSGVNLAARLDEYLRTESPDNVLRRLVLSRRENVDLALKHLGLAIDEDVDDLVIVDRMLWKLGFDYGTVTTLNTRFAVLQNRMSHAARSASVSTIVDWEAMRGLAANYFVALEELLADTLAFVTWTLTTDHVSARHPFQYDSNSHRKAAFHLLSEFHAKTVTEGQEPFVYGDKTTLHPLCAGFGVLAAALASIQKETNAWQRQAHEYPEFAGHTSLQHFPFDHRCLFLDLTASSQRRILEVLREASRLMMAANVPDVRNEQLHYRRSHGDLERLVAGLTSVERTVALLEDAGLTRTLYYPDRREADRWGRRTVYFSDRRNREIALGLPSSFSWLNLPSLSQPQYLVTSAQFAEPNEIVRVTLANSSEYTELWKNFPLRRQSSRREQSLGYDTREASGQRAPQASLSNGQAV